MEILLAGGNGIIGRFLHKILESDTNITSIGIDSQKPFNDFLNIDLTNIESIVKFVKSTTKFDMLIFLVGLAHAKGKGKDHCAFEQINEKTLVNLLTLLNQVNKIPDKIIFSSTISVYGERYEQTVYDEDLSPVPFSPYGITKLKAEQFLLDNYANKSWVLRFAPVYSEDFLLNINRRTKIGNMFYKIGNGTKKLSLCNIENIKATVEGIVNEKVPPGVYNLSDNQEYTYNQLMDWYGAEKVLRIPFLAVRLLYFVGRISSNIFLKENSIKLITDNIFSSDKIRSYIDLPANIYDVKLSSD